MVKASDPTPEVVKAEVHDPARRPASAFTKEQARRLTGDIKRRLDRLETDQEALRDKVAEAHRGKAWAALGYASWKQYVATEFEMSRQRSYQLVNWADLNRELEAAGQPPAATEREARAAIAERSSVDAPAPPRVNQVDTRGTPDQPKHGGVDAKSSIAERVEQAFKTDSATAAEALVECKPVETRDWPPGLLKRLASWVEQAGKVGVSEPGRQASRLGDCPHPKARENKLSYGVFCGDCKVRLR